MNKTEMLKDFLLSKEISEETKKQRLAIAWNIWENLPNILKDEITLIFEEVKEELKSKLLSDWDIQNTLKSQYNKWSGIYLFKKSWTSEGKYLLSVALEPDNWSSIAYSNMFISVRKSDSIKDVDFKSIRDELDSKFRVGSPSGGDRWVWYKYLDEYRRTDNKAFLEEVALNRMNIVKYYAENCLSLKGASEVIIEKAIEEYKNQKARL